MERQRSQVLLFFYSHCNADKSSLGYRWSPLATTYITERATSQLKSSTAKELKQSPGGHVSGRSLHHSAPMPSEHVATCRWALRVPL